MKPVKIVFEKKPEQWGFRGDPYLWDDLMKAMMDVSVSLGSKEFELVLKNKFQELVKVHGVMKAHDTVWFSKYPQDGMSGGGVSMEWWQKIGLPLLMSRYAELTSNNN